MRTIDEIEGHFLTLKNCIRVTVAHWMLPHRFVKPSDGLSEEALELLNKFGMPLQLVEHFLDDPENLRFSHEQTFFLLLRSSLVNAHEFSKSISREYPAKEHLFTDAPFGLVSWILRNSWGHDLKIKFSPAQRKLLPARWGDIELTENVEGRSPTRKEVPPLAAYSLIEAHEQLCIQLISP